MTCGEQVEMKEPTIRGNERRVTIAQVPETQDDDLEFVAKKTGTEGKKTKR